MPEESKTARNFKELKWSDLQDWAGGKATAKGIKYQEEGRVKEIKCTSIGSLVARVEGTIEYFTEVSLENGKLSSICTCPVGYDCKHGVAAVLEYLDLIEQGEDVPVVTEEDPLIKRSRRGFAGAGTSGAYQVEKSSQVLQEYLEKLEKPELIQILTTFAKKDNMLGIYLTDRQHLSSENPEGVIGNIYSELDGLWRELKSFDFWSYESEEVPDFSKLQVRLESLLDSGHPDEILDIGKELMDRYNEIEEYDEERDIGTQISGCMDVVFRALSQSFLPAHEKMLYALDLELKDNHSILNEPVIWREAYSQEEWNLFAETLKVRLQKAEKEKEKETDILYESSWERDYIVDRLIDALRKAGRSEEIIPISELEVEMTGNYTRLVRELLDSGQKKRAEDWIYKGIKELREYDPGTAYELLQTLIEIKESEGNWLFIAALETEDFFRYPQLSSYIKMQKAAIKIGKWPEIREVALQYLRTGELPVRQSRTTGEFSIIPGILPESGLLEVSSLEKIKPPVLDLLIHIAIQENDADEVVHWYEELKKSKGAAEIAIQSILGEEIANAIKDKYPEVAIEIWKTIAEELISKTKVNSYEVASIYLRKIKETLESIGKKEEWEVYLNQIRKVNRFKKKLLEILNRLDKSRILDK
ncbi:SWIM zinc finger domain-containing protein [Methanosarcina sp. DH1]|uniref:SWIM zinc finger family protein n=1 Tax=Methanosarcina sp. DH1 TaxID=2605695 RepID=UPI001E5BECA1|nr:SWIM zinc finger domain-containing protein [Methanosarcina sp. DH1]MCC4766970.1 SWIM zinc finger domain-containing protein [Methanosarcina sp. DH1]